MTFKEFLEKRRITCRYDGEECTRARMCYDCPRLNLDNLPHSRDPVKLIIWEDDFLEGGTGSAKCPECRELVYGLNEDGTGQCLFCGQHYQLDEKDKEKLEPNPEETIDCPRCGKHTLTGRRMKVNGHFHGTCANCGCIVMD